MTIYTRNNRPDLLRYRAVLFDADGTLRRCTVPGQVCPNRLGEWELIPGTKEYLDKLPDHLSYGLVSNQGGVAAGKLSHATARQLLGDLADALWDAPVPIALCFHSSKGNCLCRKPSPMMILVAASLIPSAPRLPPGVLQEVQRHQVLYVGDMESDKEAAVAAGVDFMWADEFFER